MLLASLFLFLLPLTSGWCLFSSSLPLVFASMMEACCKVLAGEGGTVDDDGGRDCGIIGVIKVDLAVLATTELIRLASSPM